MFTVTTPAGDLTLLTIQEMRAAAGVADNSRDAELQAHETKVADSISTYCSIAVAGTARPTLKRETLTETFRAVNTPALILSRRHAVSVTTVTVDGTDLNSADFEVDTESGKLLRLVNDSPADWRAGKVVVVYDAGFSTAPPDLKMAATDFFRLSWRERCRDLSLKSEEIEIPGVEKISRTYWVDAIPGGGAEAAVPGTVAGQLQRYRNFRL